ncbi:MAG: SDR family oxidoreductase [Myxococcota bacterium]
MKVLITGGAGYIGTATIAALGKLDRALEIVVYDNLSRNNRNFFIGHPFPDTLSLQFVQADILDTRKLSRAIDGVDVVVHLAARVTTPFANDDPHLYEQVNHWGTAELSYILERSPPKQVIYLSSASVYGGGDGAFSVASPPRPRTWYGTSKLRGEQMLERLLDDTQMHILRCGNVYGYNRSMRFDAVINRFVFESLCFGRISIHGDGDQGRAFIHIDHVAQALARLIDGTDLPSGTYDLIDRNLTINELVAALRELVPDLETLFIEQDMPRRTLMVRPDYRLLERELFVQRPLVDELTTLRDRFSIVRNG